MSGRRTVFPFRAAEQLDRLLGCGAAGARHRWSVPRAPLEYGQRSRRRGGPSAHPRPFGFNNMEAAIPQQEPLKDEPDHLVRVSVDSATYQLCPRSDVREDVVSSMVPLVERAVAGHPVPLSIPGYMISARPSPGCVLLTFWGEAKEGHGKIERTQNGSATLPGHAPLLTLAVATDQRAGAVAWHLMHRKGSRFTIPPPQPPAPWVAERIESRDYRMIEWADEWIQCIAWAWLDVVARSATRDPASGGSEHERP